MVDMANRYRCPVCGETGDMRGANSHMRYKHNMPNATANDVEVIEETGLPVREVNNEGELREQMETSELVGVADNAIVFRNEIIITDPQIKERIADALVEKMGAHGASI